MTDSLTKKYNTVNISLTHPNLYRSIIVFAFITIGLGLNFIFANPTFNQYQIPKEIIGSIFLILGISKLAFLTVFRNLKMLRINMAICTGFLIFWGVGTSITFFTGQTSLQLFILYLGLAAIQFLLLQEPFVNPLTKRSGEV